MTDNAKLWIVFVVILIWLLVWLEELNYREVHLTVKRRHASGDTACRAKKVWWGWRVQELAEGIDDD